MLFAGLVRTWVNVVSRRDVLRAKKIHQSIFVGNLFVIAKMMRHHGPEKEAEEKQDDSADQDWQPEVDKEFHLEARLGEWWLEWLPSV